MKWAIVNIKDGNWAFFIGSNLLCREMMGVDNKLMGQVEAHTDVIVLTGY